MSRADITSYHFLHTTSIDVETTAGEMMKLLARIGATHINHTYDGGKLRGMAFTVVIGDATLNYKMPINSENVFQSLKKASDKGRQRGQYGRAYDTRIAKLRAQAERTAWRLALEWLKVQVAFVTHGVKTAPEVFMSDLIIKDPGGSGKLITMGDYMLQGGGMLKLTGGN